MGNPKYAIPFYAEKFGGKQIVGAFQKPGPPEILTIQQVSGDFAQTTDGHNIRIVWASPRIRSNFILNLVCGG